MFKARRRSIISLVLAFVTVFLVSCGSPTVKKPPTYTSAQLEQIQQYVSGIERVQERMPELADLIQKENWVFVRNFIRGPLGELRTQLSLIERNLLPQDRTKASETAKELFKSLILIDEAAQKQDYKTAIRNYAVVQKRLLEFVDLTPKA